MRQKETRAARDRQTARARASSTCLRGSLFQKSLVFVRFSQCSVAAAPQSTPSGDRAQMVPKCASHDALLRAAQRRNNPPLLRPHVTATQGPPCTARERAAANKPASTPPDPQDKFKVARGTILGGATFTDATTLEKKSHWRL